MKAHKIKEIPQDDLAALLEFAPRAFLGSRTRERKALAGKRPVPAGDRRRKPAGQKRDKQLNVNVSEDLLNLVDQLARRQGVSKAELIDRAVRALAASGAAK